MNNFQINKIYQLEHYIIIMYIQMWCEVCIFNLQVKYENH